MRDNGAVMIRGEVLEVTLREGKTTKGADYSFHILNVLTGATVSEVRWPSGNDQLGPAPKEGDRLNLEVTLDVFNGRQQIEAKRHVTGSRASAPAA